MKHVSIDGHVVEMYDSIDELPMWRFHIYNKMLLIDAGIGSDISDFDKHLKKAIAYARSTTPAMAATELENLRQNVFFLKNDISPKMLSFAILIKSIDGHECKDHSEDGLRAIADKFRNATVAELTATIEAVKKKIDEELDLYFPKVFDDVTVKEYYDVLKQRTLTILNALVDGKLNEPEVQARINNLTTRLLTFTPPHVFAGSEGLEVQYDKQFEDMCILISEQLNVSDPKRKTVLEYYTAFERIQSRAREQRKRKVVK